jgi:uncharacterized protein
MSRLSRLKALTATSWHRITFPRGGDRACGSMARGPWATSCNACEPICDESTSFRCQSVGQSPTSAAWLDMMVLMVDRNIYGPWAVIAGGSEGVGAAFAEQLATAGINLVLIARNTAPLLETAETCRAAGVLVRTVAADLTQPDGVSRVFQATADVQVGLLVYNAGANTCSEEFLAVDLKAFEPVIDLSIGAMLQLVHHFGRPMRERMRGGILLVGSTVGYAGSARHTIYGGVKAFGRIFAESLWIELREYNVHVLELVLGVTRTPAMERVGLNFDVPGLQVADPADVAREGLEHLANGPVHIAGGNGAGVERSSRPDRARVVLATHRIMQNLMRAGTTE